MEPPNGTVISAELGSTNVTTIRCEIYTSTTLAVQEVTLWKFENGSDLIPITRNDSSIRLHGNEATNSIVFKTSQNLLTILQFDASLDNISLRCGPSDEVSNIGIFPLIVYSKQMLWF